MSPVPVEMVKCACTDCVCVVSPKAAIEHKGRIYCSDSCAGHHAEKAGCDHAGCTCGG